MLYMILGFIGFIILFIIARVLNERNVKTLNQDEKAMMVDAFSSFRKYSLIPVLGLIVLYFLLAWRIGSDVRLYALFLVLLLCYVIAINLFVVRKLLALHLPRPVVRSYVFTSLIKLAGLGIFFAVMFRYYL
ncbi:MAG: hypothetical protein JXA20_01880 [Spirochaetes bacterium]|nr:hypothetical protein [Spirochaetota bacterium]